MCTDKNKAIGGSKLVILWFFVLYYEAQKYENRTLLGGSKRYFS